MAIAEKYNPQTLDAKWYQYWMEQGYFRSTPDHRPAYTIVIPPPNVTGVLHMGHLLNNTLQDVLIRRARMTGYNACWIPGTDHASIATEAKVVAKLKEEGIAKKDITREEFLKHAWSWTEQYGGTILKQLKSLGCSCDWDRLRFTLEDKMSDQVIRSFVDLYNKGLIYRGFRMVNWDPEAKTNISDEEVIYKDQSSQLYHLKYKIEGTEDYLVVATQRPETIFGDIAVCLNPNDPRREQLEGKKLLVPIVGRWVKVIFDEYVDPDFGTGALKITPAHSMDDYEIGLKFNLEIIDTLDDDGKLNELTGNYARLDRFVARKKILNDLKELDLVDKVENYMTKIPTSERTGAVVEPKISRQWFLKVADLAKPALDAVMEDKIKFYPRNAKNTYRHWMENIRDWNISRQLWWGQQIPAYYFDDGDNDFVVAENKEKALELAKEKSGKINLSLSDLRQDNDTLDTWFSSWLWPISVFDGLLEDDSSDINYYYPTSDLVTGPDIMFFWVARMIMSGLEWRKQIPFQNVYFTGIVRDKLGRKMSKSLGNSPDAQALINLYGADAVRMGLLMSSAAGNDLMYDEALIIQGRNFATKIWNAFRLMQGWTKTNTSPTPAETQALNWFKNQLNKTIIEVADHFSKFRLSDAAQSVYKLIWDDFCSWYLEAIKPSYGEGISCEVYDQTIVFFEELLRQLHPFMPFITEEVYQGIKERNPEEALIISQQKQAKSFDEKILNNFATSREIVSGVRNFRQSQGISPKEKLNLYTSSIHKIPNQAMIQKLANLEHIHFGKQPEGPSSTFLAGTSEFSLPLSSHLNLDEEKRKTEEEINYLEGFLISVEKKLSNDKFISNAKPEIVANEQKKRQDALDKITLLKSKLQSLT